eukprot:551761-Hanusia_phi.AAC.1
MRKEWGYRVIAPATKILACNEKGEEEEEERGGRKWRRWREGREGWRRGGGEGCSDLVAVQGLEPSQKWTRS